MVAVGQDRYTCMPLHDQFVNATVVKVSVGSTTVSRCDLLELFSNSQTIISLGNRRKAQSRNSVAKLNRQLVALSLNATLVAAALNLLCELLPLFFISLPEECLQRRSSTSIKTLSGRSSDLSMYESKH